jgi:hypothetical protein
VATENLITDFFLQKTPTILFSSHTLVLPCLLKKNSKEEIPNSCHPPPRSAPAPPPTSVAWVPPRSPAPPPRPVSALLPRPGLRQSGAAAAPDIRLVGDAADEEVSSSSGMAPPRRLEASERRRRPRSGGGISPWGRLPKRSSMRRRRSFQIGGELAGEGVGGERKHAEALQRRDRRGERAREAAALGGRRH